YSTQTWADTVTNPKWTAYVFGGGAQGVGAAFEAGNGSVSSMEITNNIILNDRIPIYFPRYPFDGGIANLTVAYNTILANNNPATTDFCLREPSSCTPFSPYTGMSIQTYNGDISTVTIANNLEYNIGTSALTITAGKNGDISGGSLTAFTFDYNG